MKKTILGLTVMLVISLLLWGRETSYAKVTGRCDGCHTMHNSQDGADLNAVPYGVLLLRDGCVGCHSHLSETLSYPLGTSTVPVVNSGVDPSSSHLAGGNFYWVADAGANQDAKGHNVFGISGQDEAISVDEGAPGNQQVTGECQTGGCHGTLAAETISDSVLADYDGFRSGCQGCHLNVRHHADDGTGTKYVDNENQGWYRFLAGHAGTSVLNYGVEGIEDEDWQATIGATDHNEYLGVPVDKNDSTSLQNGSMTAFCCGCHGNFHVQNENVATDPGSQSPWIRHPSDFVIPDSGEYADMSTTYSTLSPVARPVGFAWASNSPSSNVIAGDMVMCLSCHRPHGSPNDDLLRWPYADMIAGGGGGLDNQGCFYCHVTKDD